MKNSLAVDVSQELLNGLKIARRQVLSAETLVGLLEATLKGIATKGAVFGATYTADDMAKHAELALTKLENYRGSKKESGSD